MNVSIYIKPLEILDYNTISKNHLLSIPLFTNGSLRYTLNLISKKSIKMNKTRYELIDYGSGQLNSVILIGLT